MTTESNAGNLTIDEVLEKFILIRTRRTELKTDYEKHDSGLKLALERLEGWLLQKSNELGVDQFKKKGIGTAYRSRDMKVNCRDWQVFEEWLLQTRQLAFFERRISRATVKEFMDANEGKVPPALEVIYEDTFNVRRDAAPKEKA